MSVAKVPLRTGLEHLGWARRLTSASEARPRPIRSLPAPAASYQKPKSREQLPSFSDRPTDPFLEETEFKTDRPATDEFR